MELTSIDFSNYIRYTAMNNHGVSLNKTQVNKMLFICYGLYLADSSEKLFNDDQPKAWPYGPVFPRVYRTFNTFSGISKSVYDEIEKKEKISKLIKDVVKGYHNFTAYQLTEWSHRPDGPWYKTIHNIKEGESLKWGAIIEDASIKEYFSNLKA
jgi:uncharacterized phage-associated protein